MCALLPGIPEAAPQPDFMWLPLLLLTTESLGEGPPPWTPLRLLPPTVPPDFVINLGNFLCSS